MNDSFDVDADGCRLACSREGAGPPVIFIQGVGVHGDAWRPQVEGLASRYCCLWFDNRGVGKSQPAAAQLSVERMALDTAAILDAARWDSAHVIGHSLGGLVALRLALSAPQRVRSLSLLCTFARGRDAGASARMAWIGLRTRIGTRRMRRSAFLDIVAAPHVLQTVDRDRMAQELAPIFGHDLADHPAIEMQQLAAMRAVDLRADLGALSVPTLVVSGAHDPISPPAIGQALAERIHGAAFELFADQAHGAPILAAERMNALLLAHLDRVERAHLAPLVTALERTCALLERSEASVWSPLTPAEVAKNLRETIVGLVRGDTGDYFNLRVEFAPTSTIQEIAMANGWHDEYLRLADVVDGHVDR